MRAEVSPQLIATSIADVFLNETKFSGQEKTELRADLTRFLGGFAIDQNKISDWNTAKQCFIDEINVLFTEQFKIEIIGDQISKVHIAEVSARDIAFVPEQIRINLGLAQLHAEVESNGVVSGEYIKSITEFTIDHVRDRY
ncbi:hypothetical protein [Methylocystis echinoides]|uniref:Uncharacterized protein n=1 Tax=Methylocystis echinoides TaxID=29468 RepID=A0A9W6GUI0_9HYPH|nr:hypothetical protein [Methylocystis echinoides]GLI93124.1 hypothetical protein LMG27198_21160 [Methylocystis echinoides]